MWFNCRDHVITSPHDIGSLHLLEHLCYHLRLRAVAGTWQPSGVRDTKPEVYVRRRVHGAGFRFRLHRRDLPGRPDLVFPRHRLAVFVHGCFWHGHDCDRAARPRTNTEYWGPKIDGNVLRDRRNAASLHQAEWDVVTIRECTVDQDTTRLIHRLEGLRAVSQQAS